MDDEQLDLESHRSIFSGNDDNFKVVIRVRPPVQRELEGWEPYQNTVQISNTRKEITLSETVHPGGAGNAASEGLLFATYRFTFDHIFSPSAEQQHVYEVAARPAVESTLQGYNASIIAYGQTGTGKTYTMEGNPGQEGIVSRAVQDIFGSIAADSNPQNQYLVRVSYLQIYNEVISDLLKTDRTNLHIREDAKRGVYVDKLSEWVVRNERELLELMSRGAKNRVTGATKMNDVSSRAHAVFMIIVERSMGHGSNDMRDLQKSVAASRQMGLAAAMPEVPHSIRVGKLNLVDLAGSERVHITGATGKRLEESKSINQSLSALGKVIAALTDKKLRNHIPYRDSKLTRILEDSLGGNCKTTMMCMVSPSLDAFAESVSTLKFANRAKTIRNKAEVNEDGDQRTLLRKYEKELKRLRSELHRRSEQLVDKRHLLQVDEQRRQAEADKLAAITELETRSKQFMTEKREKQQLEQKIASLQGQMIIGGDGLQVSPAVRKMLHAEQHKIRSEYELKFRELERERLQVQDKRAQVDGYKELLLKQRDIMLALTKRLSDRDEQILILQEELDAYDAAQRKLEDALDQRTAEVIAVRKAALEEVSKMGSKSTNLQGALGVWGRNGPDMQERPGQLTSSPARIATLHSQGPGAIEACSSPGRTSATDSDLGNARSLMHQSLDIVPGKPERKDIAMTEALQAKHAALETENGKLRSELEKLQSAQDEKEAERTQLKEELHGYVKERQALKVIVDKKIKLFVAEIIKSLDSMEVEEGAKVKRQSKALMHLVDSTAAALHTS